MFKSFQFLFICLYLKKHLYLSSGHVFKNMVVHIIMNKILLNFLPFSSRFVYIYKHAICIEYCMGLISHPFEQPLYSNLVEPHLRTACL